MNFCINTMHFIVLGKSHWSQKFSRKCRSKFFLYSLWQLNEIALISHTFLKIINYYFIVNVKYLLLMQSLPYSQIFSHKFFIIIKNEYLYEMNKVAISYSYQNRCFIIILIRCHSC